MQRSRAFVTLFVANRPNQPGANAPQALLVLAEPARSPGIKGALGYDDFSLSTAWDFAAFAFRGGGDFLASADFTASTVQTKRSP